MRHDTTLRHPRSLRLGVVSLALVGAACRAGGGDTLGAAPPAPTAPSTTELAQPGPTTTEAAKPTTTTAATPPPDLVALAALASGPTMVTTTGPSGSGCSPGNVSALPAGWWAGHVTRVDGAAVQAVGASWRARLPRAHYMVDENPRTFRVELPSTTSPATCVSNQTVTGFPCEVRHILELYADPERTFRSENDELAPTSLHEGDVVTGSFMLWLHTNDKGIADYAYMQWSC